MTIDTMCMCVCARKRNLD